MSDLKVTAVHGRGRAFGEDETWGPLIPRRFEAEGVDGIIEWNRKPDASDPRVGEVLAGDLEQTKYGWKFKKAKGAFNGGGRGMSPEERKRVERMAAHKTAAHLLASAVQLGLVDKAKVANKAGLMNLHRQIVDDLIGDLP